ncbi:hypothetical protein [Nocardia sp. NPDC060259]
MIAQRARRIDRPESLAGLLVDLGRVLALILTAWLILAVFLP